MNQLMNLELKSAPEAIPPAQPMPPACRWAEWLIALCLVWLCYSLLQNALCYLELLNAIGQMCEGSFT